MSTPCESEDVKLVSSLSPQEPLLGQAIRELQASFGPVDWTSPPLCFDRTRYYEKEMGWPLSRRFVSFRRLIRPRHRRRRGLRPDRRGDAHAGAQVAPRPAHPRRGVLRRALERRERGRLRAAGAARRADLQGRRPPPGARSRRGVRRRLGRLQRQPRARHHRPVARRPLAGGGTHHRSHLRREPGRELLLHVRLDVPDHRSRLVGDGTTGGAPPGGQRLHRRGRRFASPTTS